MFESRKNENRALDFYRASTEFRNVYADATHELARRLGLAALLLCCWTGSAAADDVPTVSTIRIAVFPFELEDFSAAAAHGSSPVVTSYLSQATEEAKQQLLQSGRYRLIDTAGVGAEAAEDPGLRNCGGCEAAIAMKVGAAQALVGVVTKISVTEYVVRVRVRDAGTGEIVSSLTTDLRMGTSDSWSRGVRWLMKNRILASK